MDLLIVLGALIFLMFVAYRGYSVILFAPVAALGAVFLTDPTLVPPMFSSVFMEKTVGFVKNYFPVFMLGAVFGKVIELSGFSKSIVSAVIGVLGRERAVLSIVVVCAILTYGGVSLFVVVFAVYPFAAEMFRQGDIPKQLRFPARSRSVRSASRWMPCRERRKFRTSFRRPSSIRRRGPARCSGSSAAFSLLASVLPISRTAEERHRNAAKATARSFSTSRSRSRRRKMPTRGSPSRRWSWWASRTSY